MQEISELDADCEDDADEADEHDVGSSTADENLDTLLALNGDDTNSSHTWAKNGKYNNSLLYFEHIN